MAALNTKQLAWFFRHLLFAPAAADVKKSGGDVY
jgi:hypothetical protein